MSRRVVVTGGSVVTGLGTDADEFWKRLCNGESGVSNIERFDPSEYKVRFGGEVKPFVPSDHMKIDSKEVKRLDRFVQFAMVAAHKAIEHSDVDLQEGDAFRHGVLVGSGIGGLIEIEEQHSRLYDRGPSRVSPYMIPKLMVNAASGNISVRWGLRGPNSAIATACASATNAIGDAFKLIQHGTADLMVTGGAEAGITPMGLSGFARMNALSTRNEDPPGASRPFDADRDGFVIAEGAGILVLEEYERAKKRGAPILAEVLGYGMTADASHMTAPDPEANGASRAITLALNDAQVNPDQIDYVNAHGTSTPLGDKAESTAIQRVFGSHAQKLAVSSTKSAIGHLLGASGGVEIVASVKTITDQVIAPTINLDTPDPDCPLDYVPNTARDAKVNMVLKNSFGFGGHNACLVLGKVD